MNVQSIKKLFKKKIVILFFLIFLSLLIFTPLIVKYIEVLEECFDKAYMTIEILSILDCYKALLVSPIVGIVYLILLIAILLFIYNIVYTKKQMLVEREGVKFKTKDGTHGTANLVTAEQIDILQIGNEENTPGIILGKTLDTDEIIILPDSCKSINRNIMIWGASGSRKDY